MELVEILKEKLSKLVDFETYKKQVTEHYNSYTVSYLEEKAQELAKNNITMSPEGVRQYWIKWDIDGYNYYKEKLEKKIRRQEYLKKDWENYGDRLAYYQQICPNCGTIFYARNPRNTYCREKCVIDASNKRISELKKAARNKVCPICNKQYTATRSDAKFCSAACKQMNYRTVMANKRLPGSTLIAVTKE